VGGACDDDGGGTEDGVDIVGEVEATAPFLSQGFGGDTIF